MNASINAHRAKPRANIELVWYEGDDALYEGEGVCYNSDYGTATTADARRTNHVERPSSSNNRRFAGVAARDYKARLGGQMVEINNPGSVCNIALGADTVVDTGMLTCQAGGAAGRFSDAGFIGRGSAIPLQTVTGVLESDKTGGAWSLATDGVTLTVASTTGVSAGDTVVFLASEDEGTSKAIIPGKYTVSSVTDATTLVLTATAVGATPGAALTCSGYIYTGNPKALALLLDGEESGLVEWLSPPNAGSADFAHMVGGISYVNGGVTLAADCDIDLADGTIFGEKKGVILKGTLTTNDLTVDLDTAGMTLAGNETTALAEINAMDAAGDACFLQWNGIWICQGVVGGATQA
jgi:hypothetical protein